jgi:hypothetical protein
VSVVIPDSVTVIGSEAFHGCTGLTSIIIPDSVTEIGPYAFEGCTGLTSIVLSNAVEELEANVFKECTSLTNIVIPDSVKKIESCAFKGCTSLTDIVIPDSVKKIESCAFKGCTSLTGIVIPDAVEEIEYSVVSECPGLTSIVVSEGNKTYDSRSNCNAIIKTDTNALLAGCSKTVIPDSVTEICVDAFQGCTSLTSIVIPASVTKIERYKAIGGHGAYFQPFMGCKNLESIVVAEGNEVFDSRDNCNAIIETSSNYLIAGCKNTVIPDSVEKILENAFYGSCLTEIVIPDSVIWVLEGAFAHCESLQSVVIGKSVSLLEGADPYRSYVGAFKGCTSLTSIVIPESVTRVGAQAFAGCNNLTSIVVSEDNKKLDSRDNCNAIIETKDNKLVVGCSTTHIPSTVTVIGESAFHSCDTLTGIDIPESVTKIEGYAFRECNGLTSIVIPETVQEIERCAFWCCTNMKSASVLGAVKEMDSTFTGCSSLETVTLGAGIKKMEDVFECESLKTINVPAKKADYYKKRLPEELHSLIVELPAEKKAKKK